MSRRHASPQHSCRHRGLGRHRCDGGHACRRSGGRGRDQPDRASTRPSPPTPWARSARPGSARSCAGTSSSRTVPVAGTLARSRAWSSTRRSRSSAASRSSPSCSAPRSGRTARPIHSSRRATRPTSVASWARSPRVSAGRSPPGRSGTSRTRRTSGTGRSAPAQYAPLLTAAHTAIHEADPGALVLAGASTGNDYPFLEGLYARRRRQLVRRRRRAHRHRLPRHAARQLLPRGRRPRRALQLPRVPRGAQRARAERARRSPDHHDRARLVGDEDALLARGVRRQEGRGRHRGPAGRLPQARLPLPQLLPVRRARRCGSRSRDTGSADTELTRYGLQRADGSRRPACDALAGGRDTATSAATAAATSRRPASTSSRPRRTRSTTARWRSRPSPTTTRASSAGSRSTRTTRKIRSFTGDALRNGRPVGIDWMGARDAALRPGEGHGSRRSTSSATRRTARSPSGASIPRRCPRSAPSVKLRLAGQGPEAQGPRPGQSRPARRSCPAARSSSSGSTSARAAGSRCTSAARTPTAPSSTRSVCASPGAGGSSPATRAHRRSRRRSPGASRFRAR